jgi:hypothetical protein
MVPCKVLVLVLMLMLMLELLVSQRHLYRQSFCPSVETQCSIYPQVQAPPM